MRADATTRMSCWLAASALLHAALVWTVPLRGLAQAPAPKPMRVQLAPPPAPEEEAREELVPPRLIRSSMTPITRPERAAPRSRASRHRDATPAPKADEQPLPPPRETRARDAEHPSAGPVKTEPERVAGALPQGIGSPQLRPEAQPDVIGVGVGDVAGGPSRPGMGLPGRRAGGVGGPSLGLGDERGTGSAGGARHSGAIGAGEGAGGAGGGAGSGPADADSSGTEPPSNSGEGGGSSGDESATDGAGPITRPAPRSLLRPNYPERARRAGKEGTVRVRVLVGVDGSVRRVQVVQSSGVPELDAAARKGARRWRFAPARRGDTPIEAWVTVPVEFDLRTTR